MDQDDLCPKKIRETIAPFNTSEPLHKLGSSNGPGPDAYFAEKPVRTVQGSPIMRPGNRFPDPKPESLGISDGIAVPSEWDMITEKIYHQCSTMRPRVKFPKSISNNVPSIFHPLDIRSFIKGGDRRMYPWRRPKRTPKIPGPIYDTYQVYTSQSYVSPVVDFGNSAERGPLFKTNPDEVCGGPAAYNTEIPLNPNGGIFLSKSSDPDRSDLRLMDILVRDGLKPHPGPGSHCVPRDLDKPSPKACTAPFKSTVPSFGRYPLKFITPSPLDYFRTDATLDDLQYRVWPYPKLRLPSKPPFLTSASRFGSSHPSLTPAPNRYFLASFTEQLCYDAWKHAAAICNPRLGFLVSAEAHPDDQLGYRLDALRGVCDSETVPGTWRNLRPRKGLTYAYHACAHRTQQASPGPIYETASAMKAIRGKRDWFDPRGCKWTGFNNSGCGRITMATPDRDIPGPKYLIPSYIPGPGAPAGMAAPAGPC